MKLSANIFQFHNALENKPKKEACWKILILPKWSNGQGQNKPLPKLCVIERSLVLQYYSISII